MVAVWTMMMLALILQPHSLVHANRSSQQGQPFDGRFTTRRNDLSRGIQSILIKKQALSKTRGWKSPTRKTAPSVQGSILTFQKPTKARIWRWFGVDEAPGSLRCMLQRQFNHGYAGMTNPCVSLDPDEKRYNNMRLRGWSKGNSMHEVAMTSAEPSGSSTSNDDGNINTTWWPTLSFAPEGPKKWRVLKYTRKVGKGVHCYKRVRDAALDWEFNAGDDTGLLSVPSTGSSTVHDGVYRDRYTVTPIDEGAVSEIELVPPYRCIGSARHLVSYSAKKLAPFLPKLYSINPVMIAYDAVDQRGPSTTFSCSAYATMKGHLLRGEERVTVALRDGTEDVEVQIVSISQAGPSINGRAVWPFIGKMQSTFFEAQMDFLEKIGTISNAEKIGR